MKKRKPGAGRPIKESHPWRDLAISVGGSSKLAELMGVSNSTITKWASGLHRVPILAQKELERLCVQHGIEIKTK